MEEGNQNLLAQIGSCGVLLIPNTANVISLLGGDNQGGYGMVHMVRIDHIPSTIKLTKKTPKMDDKREAHKQWLMKALACPWEHPGVIKFLAIHT